MTERPSKPKHKIAEYRAAARRAEEGARAARDPDIRQAYLQIMSTWMYLADELEREMRFGGQEPSESDQTDDIFVPKTADRPAHKSH